MEVVLVVAALVMAIAGSIRGWLRLKRRGEIEAVAARAGLEYAADDPFDCTRVAFPLFRRGDGRGAENVLWRAADRARPVRAFDYWYYVEHRNDNGGTSRSYEYFTCALALVNGSWPELTVCRDGLRTKVESTLGLRDLDFESEEFNRLFAVRCPDPRFASALIDARMMAFLLSTRGELAFEIKGRWLLVWTRKVPPPLMPGLLKVCEQFVAHIPPVVWELYPSPFLDDDGNPLPAEDDPVVVGPLVEPEPEHDRDPFAVLDRSPFDALGEPGRPEFDLDGNVIRPAQEDPWRDIGGDPFRGHRGHR